MKLVIITFVANALTLLVTAHDGHVGYALHEMSEEEAFLELVKRSGDDDIAKFGRTDKLERRGWEVIELSLENGPSADALNRLGPMIRIVGLHPSSTRYSVDKSIEILKKVLPQIEEVLSDDRRVEFAEYKESKPFGGTGEQDAPDGYDEFLRELRYFDEIVAGAMNVVAIKGVDKDAVVFEAFSDLRSEPFPVSYSSMAKASELALDHRLKRENTVKQSGDPDLHYVANQAETPDNGNKADGVEETHGDVISTDANISTIETSHSNWMYAFFGLLALGLLYFGFTVFFRNRNP